MRFWGIVRNAGKDPPCIGVESKTDFDVVREDLTDLDGPDLE